MMVRKSIKFEKQEFARTTDFFDEERKLLQNTDDHVEIKVQSKIPKETFREH